MHVHPPGGENKFGSNLQEKVVSAPPAEQGSIFRKLGRSGRSDGAFSSFSLCFEGDN